MKHKEVHISHREEGWQVKSTGSVKPVYVVATRAEAMALGREIARHNQGELVVHRLDGTIGERNSYFHPDPFPPRG